MKLAVDKERAYTVFDRALEALHARVYPYHNILTPGQEGTLPKTMPLGGALHGRFLFLSCLYMRGGIKSDHAFRAMGVLFDEHPHFFDPEWFRKNKGGKITRLEARLREYSLGYHASWVAPSWFHNLEKLAWFWESDPSNLLSDITSYEDACSRIMYPRRARRREPDNPHGFCGFREKMVSMLIYFLTEGGLADEFVFPVPVDVQVLRILVANRIICAHGADGRPVTEGVLEPEGLRPLGRELTHDYCLDNDVSSLRLADALWWLGRTACPSNPGNRTLQIGERDGRNTKIVPNPISWSPGQIRSFERSCGRCPLQSTCELNVPGRINSINGTITVWGRRKHPPNEAFWLFV